MVDSKFIPALTPHPEIKPTNEEMENVGTIVKTKLNSSLEFKGVFQAPLTKAALKQGYAPEDAELIGNLSDLLFNQNFRITSYEPAYEGEVDIIDVVPEYDGLELALSASTEFREANEHIQKTYGTNLIFFLGTTVVRVDATEFKVVS